MIQQVFARRKAYFLACYRGANFDERPIRTADIGNGLTTRQSYTLEFKDLAAKRVKAG